VPLRLASLYLCRISQSNLLFDSHAVLYAGRLLDQRNVSMALLNLRDGLVDLQGPLFDFGDLTRSFQP
jgi:hypothetical protein